MRKVKDFLRRFGPVRDIVRQYRLRRGQPNWKPMLASSTPARRAMHPKRVLFATSDGAYLAATRMESLLGLALRERGAEVHVLLCDGALPACIECNRDWYPDPRQVARHGPTKLHCNACFSPAFKMFRSAGLTVHRYSDWIEADDIARAEEIAAGVTVENVRDFQWEGLAIGEHALAGTLRYYARATLDGEPQALSILRRYVKAAMLTAGAMRRLLAAITFDSAVFHHGIYIPHGIIGDVARQEGVRVVNWHVAYRKQSFIFSHGDTYHHTLMNEPVSAWEDIPWGEEIENETMKYLTSRWYGSNDWIRFHREPEFDTAAIEAEIGIDFSRPTVGLLTNVMWDAQLHYPANAFPNMLEWVLATIEYFRTRPDLQLLIRVHPAEITGTLRSRQPIVEEVRTRYPLLPPNVFIIGPESKVSTYAAVSKCNAVLIYGTKTGVEVTAMGIPTIVAGEAWIRNKGITTDVTSAEHYLRLLGELPFRGRLDAETVRRARKYAFHFFFRRMIPIELFGSKFEIAVESLSQLRRGASAGLDVVCDGVLNGTPFVYPAEEAVVAPEIEEIPQRHAFRAN